MTNERFVIQSKTPFAESIIWQLNRDFYQEQGIKAWSEGVVPHQMTSNSQVGKTYAELIFAFLKDLAEKGKIQEVVYIVELGAGHGRLAFHILKHLQKLVASTTRELPNYCYILSDIVEDNLSFFMDHPQLQVYLEQGQLDVAYFDAIGSKEMQLRYAKKTIYAQELNTPILAVANYFFDSIPNDLYYINDRTISACSVSIESNVDPVGVDINSVFKAMKMTYYVDPVNAPPYENPILNEILDEYKDLVTDSYIFYPEKGMHCLDNLRNFSTEGLMLLTMDKGFHEASTLSGKKEPDIISHGSFSLWVNYHTLGSYCEKQGGTTFFPSFSNFHLELACLMFLPDGESYTETKTAYEKVVDDFGPDDFNSIKKLAYANVAQLTLRDLIAIFRLSSYDSNIFSKFFPKVKHLSKVITHEERDRLVQTIDRVWDMYFHINEPFDLAYETGGVLYDLGHYTKALTKFQQSLALCGDKADVYYNQALCYYQLRKDKLFYASVKEGERLFPDSKLFVKLMELDMV